MDRRAFLVFSAACAGCTSISSDGGVTPEDDGRSDDLQSSDGAKSSSDPPSVKDTPTPQAAVEETLSYGEWVSTEDYGFTVTDTEFKQQVYDGVKKDQWVDTPDGTQLHVTHLKAKNISQEERYYPSSMSWAVVVNQVPKEPTGGWENSEYGDYGYDLDWSRLADRKVRMNFSGVSRRLQSGEIVELWFGTLVSVDTSLSDAVPAVNQDMHGHYQFGWSP